MCDQLKTEQDAEKCAEEGYTCLLCRPKDTLPPHLALPPPTPPACSTPKLKLRSLSPVKTPGNFQKFHSILAVVLLFFYCNSLK